MHVVEDQTAEEDNDTQEFFHLNVFKTAYCKLMSLMVLFRITYLPEINFVLPKCSLKNVRHMQPERLSDR